MLTVDVVIVTYNRLDKLKKALDCYSNQSVSFRTLIVVDNHSTDDTKQFLEEWKKQDAPFEKIVLRLDKNTGGSGGFYAGQQFALSRNPDWIFLADDDAYVSADTFEKFYSFTETNNCDSYSAICGAVISPQGNICREHRAYDCIKNNIYFEKKPSLQTDYERPYFTIDFLSYVGVFLKSAALTSIGLVNPDYFIYHDDAEHSLRLKKYGNIICIPGITIIHDTWVQEKHSAVVEWRKYYDVRNHMHMLLKHHPLCALNNIRFYVIQMLKKNIDVSLYRRALLDAITNYLGINPQYKP